MALVNVSWDLRQGRAFSEALGRYPRLFSETYCSAVREGEVSGRLGNTLERLCQLLESRLRFSRTLKGALIYPISVVLVGGFAGVIAIRLVIPIVEEIILGSSAALPWPTFVLTEFLNLLAEPGFQGTLALLLLLALLFRKTLWQSADAKYHRHVWLLKLPLLGRLCRVAALARISATLSSTVQVGLPLTQCLQCCSEAAGQEVFRRDLLKARTALINGVPLERYFQKRSELYTKMFGAVIQVGLETGELDRCASALGMLLETELESRLDMLANFFGPTALLLVGGMVGFVGLAVLLPLHGGI